MTVGSFLRTATEELQQANIHTARLDVLVLLADALGRDKAGVLAHDDELLEPQLLSSLRQKITRRAQHEPLSYIRGTQEFFGYDFAVTPDVLIPRPETETLVESALKLDIDTILDVGTGSGAMAIAVKLIRPTLQVFACDISTEALAVARQNAKSLGAEVQFVQSDLLANTPVAHPNCIVANLPYVDITWERSPETDFEPRLALFSDDSGLALTKTLITQAASILPQHGYLLLEADPRQHKHLATYATNAGLNVETIQGYCLTFSR